MQYWSKLSQYKNNLFPHKSQKYVEIKRPNKMNLIQNVQK